MKEITLQGVKDVVMRLPKNNTTRPDGFTSYNFQVGWELLGEDIVALLEES